MDGESHVTLHDVEVLEVLKGDEQIGRTIVLRQSGKDDPSILQNSETALLFLLPSGLPGDLASQFFPKGVYAGIYMIDDSADAEVFSRQLLGLDNSADTDAIEFSRLITQTGDGLPETVSLADVRALADKG